jgi:hypothetical protein
MDLLSVDGDECMRQQKYNKTDLKFSNFNTYSVFLLK